jgi:hypothetical protein
MPQHRTSEDKPHPQKLARREGPRAYHDLKPEVDNSNYIIYIDRHPHYNDIFLILLILAVIG